jgi:hypothetical protein
MASILVIDTENGEQQIIRTAAVPPWCVTPEDVAKWIDEAFPDDIFEREPIQL